MKRKLCVLIAMIMLVSCLLPLSVSAEGDYTRVRVLLSTSSTTSFNFKTSGTHTVAEINLKISAGSHTVKIDEGILTLTTGGKTHLVGSTVTLVNSDWDGTSCTTTLTNSKYGTEIYLGNINFSIYDGSIRVVNDVNMEQYLYGVVPYEMSNSFPEEALKVQAVCARSYALEKRISNWDSKSQNYDILDTSAHQVYHGYNEDHTRAMGAVDDTEGMGLTYKGDLAQTYYSASNGGQTIASGVRWTTHIPYLITKDDPYDLRNDSSLEELSFIPATYNSSTVKLMDDFVHDKIEDAMRTATKDSKAVITGITNVVPSDAYDEGVRDYKNFKVTLNAKLSDGTSQKLTVTIGFSSLYYNSSSNPNGVFDVEYGLRMQGVEEATVSGQSGWYLTNRGWGHGVGMSQRGAQQMAEEGFKYTEILDFYYPGTELDKIMGQGGSGGSVELEVPAEFNAKLSANSYAVTEGTHISGVAENTDVSKFISNVSDSDFKMQVKDASGKTVTSGTMATGMEVSVTISSKTYTYSIIVKGDVSGDGKISVVDLIKCQQSLLGDIALGSVYKKAGDFDASGALNVVDLIKIQQYLLA